jgi:Putative lumazine-binding
MRSRVVIVAGACVAVGLGGCSLTPTSSGSSGGFTGTSADVATTLNTLSSDGTSANGADICAKVLSTALVKTLNRVAAAAKKGDTCATVVVNQLKTVDDFSLSIKTIVIKGSTATARVQTAYLGKKVVSGVSLVNESGSWRIASIGAL